MYTTSTMYHNFIHRHFNQSLNIFTKFLKRYIDFNAVAGGAEVRLVFKTLRFYKLGEVFESGGAVLFCKHNCFAIVGTLCRDFFIMYAEMLQSIF